MKAVVDGFACEKSGKDCRKTADGLSKNKNLETYEVIKLILT